MKLRAARKLLKTTLRNMKWDKNVVMNDTGYEYLGSDSLGEVRLEQGRAEAYISGKWRRIPNDLWAWKPYDIIYRRCKKCSFNDDCRHEFYGVIHYVDRRINEPLRKYKYTIWRPELLNSPKLEHTRGLPIQLTKSPRASGRRDAATLAAQLPQELFEHIYAWDDCELARTCRAVCRHWETQCKSVAFRSIRLQSEKKVFDLMRNFKHNPAWQHIPMLVKEIKDLPDYNQASKVPWMHLLSHWKLPELKITGPFPGRQTIRSIHFALPRSPPPLLSRGIVIVYLWGVEFCRFEDLTRLAAELLDLEVLTLSSVTWESLPTELPRRRPRFDRNQLREVTSRDLRTVAGVESPPFAFAVLTLFLGVYSESSFFPSAILPVTQVLTQMVYMRTFLDKLYMTASVRSNSDGRVSHLATEPFSTSALITGRLTSINISVQLSEDSRGENNILIFINYQYIKGEINCWALLDSAFATMPPSWHSRILLGFDHREDILAFGTYFVKTQLASLVNLGEMRYTVSSEKEREFDVNNYWYEATLDSEELQGKGVTNPLDVYPDWTIPRS